MTEQSETISSRVFFDRLEKEGQVGIAPFERILMQVVPPFSGETVIIEALPGQSYRFDFDASLARPLIVGDDFILVFDSNGDSQPDANLVIEKLLEVARASEGGLLMPELIVDGIPVLANQLIQRVLASAIEKETLETAAAPLLSSGGSSYDDDLGGLTDLLEPQGPLGDRVLVFDTPEISAFVPVQNLQDNDVFVPFRGNGADDGVTITNLTPQASGGDVSVDEDDLASGSDSTKESLTQSGTFNISTPDDLTIGGTTVIENGVFMATTIAAPDGLGSLRLTAFNAATGEVSYSFTLANNADHVSGNGENDAFTSFAVVVTDTDGDSASNSLVVRIVDDVPTITATGAVDALTVDESTLGTDASANFADNFTIVAGADGQASVTYALSATDETDSGVVDTATGHKVYLFEESGEIVGRVGNSDDTANDAGPVVFTLSVNSAGTVELDQLRAVEHGDDTKANEAVNLSANVVTLTATVTDGDGDTASDSIQLGSTISFRDDGPSISPRNFVPVLSVDESDLDQNATVSFADYFMIDGGADGLDSLHYELSISGGNAAYPYLTDTLTDWDITLHRTENGTLEGRAVGVKESYLVFIFSVNEATGEVELDQRRPLYHNDSNDFDDSINLSADVISLNVTVTDKDGDTVQATLDLRPELVFRDDGPEANDDLDSVTKGGSTVATGNVVTGEDIGSNPDMNLTDGVVDDIGTDGNYSVRWDNLSGDFARGYYVQGEYGRLYILSSGGYRYELDSNNPTVQSLNGRQTLSELFIYTLKDGDLDSDSATLRITIKGAGEGDALSLHDVLDGLRMPDEAYRDIDDNSVITQGRLLFDGIGIGKLEVDQETDAARATFVGGLGTAVITDVLDLEAGDFFTKEFVVQF